MSFAEERTELRECGMDIPRLFTPFNTVSMHLVVLCISVINGLMFNEPFHLAGGGGRLPDGSAKHATFYVRDGSACWHGYIATHSVSRMAHDSEER